MSAAAKRQEQTGDSLGGKHRERNAEERDDEDVEARGHREILGVARRRADEARTAAGRVIAKSAAAPAGTRMPYAVGPKPRPGGAGR
jgi:hypothetical protein